MNTEDYLRRLQELAERERQRRKAEDDERNDFTSRFRYHD